ncbi:hypothetical protein [Frateuria sp. Soil773]|uniref:hypothetical protein n=1 Tax=Frateuria sp. Soil773 TaxID=1736407 RepID=UPI001F46483C|nr:hypothetical protein [Frateuria sp. Soil773]
MAEPGRTERHHLADLARRLPDAWTSSVLARIGTARLKLLRMDAASHAQEVHD